MRKYAALLLLCLALAACSNKPDFTPEEEDIQHAEEVAIFEAKDSQKKWILRADAVNFEDLSSAVLINPRLLLRQDGKDSAEVSGDSGSFNYLKKLVSIEGHARVHSFNENVTLETDRFFYDIDKDRIWSDKNTVVTRASAKITARGGIETDSKLTKIEFKKQSTRLPKTLKELEVKK